MINNRIISNTCLAVLREKFDKKKKGELVFAADRRISWGSSQYQSMTYPKVRKRNGFILAGTGDAYLCDLIVQLTNLPDIPKGMKIFNYVHQVFRRCMEETLIENGLKGEKDSIGIPEKMSAIVLLGVNRELFEISVDDSYGIVINPINAPYGHGCGGDYALGSLKTTENLKMSSEDRLTIALNVASELSAGCDNKIDIVRESDEDSEL